MTSVLGSGCRVPDMIEPVIGWRAWSFAHPDTSSPLRMLIDPSIPVPELPVMLASPHRKTPWPSGRLSWDLTCRCEMAERNVRQMKDRLAYLQEQRLHAETYTGDETPSQAVRKVQEIRELRKRCTRLVAILAALERGEDLCLCGINAFHSLGDLVDGGFATHIDTQVIGEVRLWGEVRRFERGWRAEHARIVRVWSVHERTAAKAADIARLGGFEYMGSAEPILLADLNRHAREVQKRRKRTRAQRFSGPGSLPSLRDRS
jgi:hypothetical protein